MLKNRTMITTAIGAALTMLFCGVSHAQTIGEMAEAARSKSISAPLVPQALQAPSEGQRQSKAVSVKVDAGALLVTSIYMSKAVYQAGISVGDAEIFVGVGDPVISGWTVALISANSVILKRCTNAKMCESKTLSYTLTH